MAETYIQYPVINHNGNEYEKEYTYWIFIGRIEADTPMLWPPDGKNWLTGKDPDLGKDWGQEEKAATEDEMVGWHYQLNGHKFKLQEMVKDREAWHAVVYRVAKSQMWISDWITTAESLCYTEEINTTL